MGIFIAIIVALLVGLFLGSYLFFLLITQAFKQDPSMVIEQLCKSVGFESKAVEDPDLFVNAANGEVEHVSQMVLDKAIELQVEKQEKIIQQQNDKIDELQEKVEELKKQINS